MLFSSPTYGDVTVYFSFHGLSAGSCASVLDLLYNQGAAMPPFCFFVSADDIKAAPGLIRKLYGSGHTVGIWLEEGTLREYLEVSALLFEAAKVKTVLVSANWATVAAARLADAYGLIFWGASQEPVPDGEDGEVDTEVDITETLPTESGERAMLSFDCSEGTAEILTDIFAHLKMFEYTIGTITETTIPMG